MMGWCFVCILTVFIMSQSMFLFHHMHCTHECLLFHLPMFFYQMRALLSRTTVFSLYVQCTLTCITHSTTSWCKSEIYKFIIVAKCLSKHQSNEPLPILNFLTLSLTLCDITPPHIYFLTSKSRLMKHWMSKYLYFAN